jgi:AcrR family transcriptional regulator
MPYPSKTDRERILATAMDQVEQGGVGALAIRSVAAELGVAPNALYRYFSNLAALEGALAEESRRRLLDVLRKAAGKRSAEEAIRSIAQAYVRFAREQPKVFALTLLPPDTEAGLEPLHVEMWRFVLDHVAAIYGAERAPEAAVTLWAFLHGMTALEAAQILGERNKPASSFEFGLRMWLKAAEGI